MEDLVDLRAHPRLDRGDEEIDEGAIDDLALSSGLRQRGRGGVDAEREEREATVGGGDVEGGEELFDEAAAVGLGLGLGAGGRGLRRQELGVHRHEARLPYREDGRLR